MGKFFSDNSTIDEIEKTIDPDTLSYFVQNYIEDPNYRIAAINNPNFEDFEILGTIAKDINENQDVRRAVIKHPKFTDLEILGTIAKNKEDKFFVRLDAIKHPEFKNQKILKNIVEDEENNFSLRECAIMKIDDLDFLEKIIVKSQNKGIRKAVIEKFKKHRELILSNQAVTKSPDLPKFEM